MSSDFQLLIILIILTGQHTAACVSLQRDLGRPLLWLACRRHIGEVILSDCWDSLKFEASTGPSVMLFVRLVPNSFKIYFNSTFFRVTYIKICLNILLLISVILRFKKEFTKLETGDVALFHYPEVEGLSDEERNDMTTFLRQSLEKNFVRGDYKELIELSLLVLTEGSEPENFSMKHPGALHKARWMGKLLYGIKMVLLSKQIQEKFSKSEVATKSQMNKLERFCTFAVRIYVPWWIVCPLAASAPVNDLILSENLNKYKVHDSIIAEKGLQALSRHSWYINE